MFLVSIVSFIMGILTLCLEKHKEAEDLTIVSGILTLFSGFFGVGAVVSFIAVYKINKLSVI